MPGSTLASTTPASEGEGRSWGRGLLWASVLGLWLAAALPLALGQRTLFLRDVFATHLHYKAFGARELSAGRIPAFDSAWGLGQPFRGNPNTLAFYPGNVLYLLLPFWSAFNLHYALHWLLALLTFHALARELGMGRAAALLAAITYAGCGWMLGGALTFYNILTVTAWWPLVLVGGHRGGPRGVALGGLACGLALLGGEPVTAALGLVPLLLVTVSRHGWRRGLLTTAGLGGLGLLVALPQLVETLRIIGHTVRGTVGVSAPPGFYALRWPRLAEILIPPPSGWDGPLGHWLRLGGAAGPAPYIASLYGGVVGAWLALLAARERPRWTALALAGLGLAWLGGAAGSLLPALTAGLFRYPEKLVFWWALALPLLAGWGLERAARAPVAGRRIALGLALLSSLALVAVPIFAGRWLAVPPSRVALRLGFAALLLVVAAVAGARRWATVLVALQLLALAQHRPLWVTDDVAPFSETPAWAESLGPGSEVVASTIRSPFHHRPPVLRPGAAPMQALARASAALLEPPVGVVHGLRYPLASDLEGMHSPEMAALLDRLPRLGWTERLRWLRALGAEALVHSRPPGEVPLRPVATRTVLGARIELDRIPDSAPAVRWPAAVIALADRAEAERAVDGLADPVATAVVVDAGPVEQQPGRARLVEVAGDRWMIELEGGSGVLALRRAYQPALRARNEAGARLRTLPVDTVLLGVVVPVGTKRVIVDVSDGPTVAAGTLALLACLASIGLVARGDRRRAVS
ncbi:MAG: hypothetical protein R2991_12995 [Thermoanaerobaculia bacterium]